MKTVTISSQTDMIRFGESLGKRLDSGDFVFLCGDLGAGKTTLTKGIAAGLSIGEVITSPTFQLQKRYQGRLPLYHLDLYRLTKPEELRALDLEALGEDGVTVVEWGELLQRRQERDYLEIAIEYGRAADSRRIELRPHGLRYQELVKELALC